MQDKERTVKIPHAGEFKVPARIARGPAGWQFRSQNRGAGGGRYFADHKYGGILGALNAAKAERHARLNPHHPQQEEPMSPGRKGLDKVRWTRVPKRPGDVTECDLVAQRTYELLKTNPSGFQWAMTQAQEQLIQEGLLAPERKRDPADFHRSQQKHIFGLIEAMKQKDEAQPPQEAAPVEEPVEEPPESPYTGWGVEEVPPPPLTITQRAGSALADILRHPDLPQALGGLLATAFRSEVVQDAIGEVLHSAMGYVMDTPQKAAPTKPAPAPTPPQPPPEPETALEAALRKAGEAKFEEAVKQPYPIKPAREGPKLKVIVVGLNPRQVNEFQREFNSALDLHFYYEGDSKDQLRLQARHCDWAFSTFTKSGSSVDMILRSNIAIDKSPNHKPLSERYMRAPASPHAVREKLALLANGGMR